MKALGLSQVFLSLLIFFIRTFFFLGNEVYSLFPIQNCALLLSYLFPLPFIHMPPMHSLKIQKAFICVKIQLHNTVKANETLGDHMHTKEPEAGVKNVCDL